MKYHVRKEKLNLKTIEITDRINFDLIRLDYISKIRSIRLLKSEIRLVRF